jgi:hypothetical protein
VGFQKSVTYAEEQFSRCPFVLVDQATKNRPTLDPFIVEVRHGVGRLWRAKFAGAVRPSTVVVPDVLREHHTQVPLAEDQHAVGEFGSDRAYEPFGETVRPRAARRNPDYADAHVGDDSVERRCKLTGSISDEDPELGDAIAKIHHQVPGLLGSPPAVRGRGRAQQMHGSAADLQDENTEIRWSVTAQSTGNKSHANIVDACARRNCRHVVSVHRRGAGGIRSRLRRRRIVDAPTWWPSVNSSPWILLYPQL